ncbi:hypothetical protein KDL45_06390, partial [bacterium]|nr:hypothetical protein [bacterium]
MRIRAANTNVEEVETDTVVVSFFEDERPLKGHTGMADWRLCGTLSKFIMEGRIDGHLGEKILFPMNHRMRCRKIVAMGLGASKDFNDQAFTGVCRNTADAVYNLGVPEFSLALPGSILEGFDPA